MFTNTLSRWILLQNTKRKSFREIWYIYFNLLAYYNDIIVGGISWKYDIYLGDRVIYIMTITVFDQYRRYQIGSQLLQELIRIHKNIKEIKYINLHVQISNVAAKNFYVKNGFDMVKIVENYYTDIEPKDAFYLRLKTQD